MTSRIRLTLAVWLLAAAVESCGEVPSTSVPKISTATPQIVVTSAAAQAPTEQVATQAPTAAPTTVPPTAIPPTIAPTPQLAKLGDVVEQDGYSLSAVAIEDPTQPSRLYKAEADKKLVAIEVVVGNVSGKKISVNPYNATLVDSDGFSYRPELGGRDDQIALVDLNPGERVKGWIAFKVPPEATPQSIKYEVSGFPDIVLQTGVTK